MSRMAGTSSSQLVTLILLPFDRAEHPKVFAMEHVNVIFVFLLFANLGALFFFHMVNISENEFPAHFCKELS